MPAKPSKVAPLWCAPVGKDGSLPAPRLPAKNKTGLPLYLAVRGKMSAKPPPKAKMKENYEKLKVKTKYLKGGTEAEADLQRYLREYHCADEGEEDVSKAHKQWRRLDGPPQVACLWFLRPFLGGSF